MSKLTRFGQSRRTAEPSGGLPLRVGFVPLFDCAPLVMAQELGLFEAHGLRVQLRREIGWATIREKILYGELDAAHALAPMVFAASHGLGSVKMDCLTGLVLSLEGNAITLSSALARLGVTDGASLRQRCLERAEPLVLGIPFLYSCHHFILHAWLESCGFVPRRDVRFVVVPPPQMPANLKAGNLDGFCAGEPWNSVATRARSGWRVAGSSDIAPRHPEKVLMVRREFAVGRAEEHSRLIAAVLEACRFCASPENRSRIVETLSRPEYVNVPAPVLEDGFDEYQTGEAFCSDLHEPGLDKASWILNHLVSVGLLSASVVAAGPAPSEIFRADLFSNATRSLSFNETAISIQ